LDEAFRNYAAYRNEPEAWMLSRFVCPAARLAELAGPELSSDLAAGPPFRFSALGAARETSEQFLQQLDVDLAAVDAFRARFGPQVVVDTFEVRLPDELLKHRDAAEFELVLAAAAVQFEKARASGGSVFYEAVFHADWREQIGQLVKVLADQNRSAAGPSVRTGFKLRTGGLEATAYPSAEQIAFVVAACRDAGLPWKATAGLHHPFGGFDQTLGCRTFGFLNLFGAAALAQAQSLDATRIQAILEENSPEHFRFDDDAFDWQGLRATTAQITRARQTTLLSFGSCSFDEPRQDLAAHGWP
jgi:hypothetical protein